MKYRHLTSPTAVGFYGYGAFLLLAAATAVIRHTLGPSTSQAMLTAGILTLASLIGAGLLIARWTR